MRFAPVTLLIMAALAAAASADAGALEQAQKGRLIFQNHCALCHDDSAHMLNDNGPALFGVVGRRVGSVPGFAYSTSLQDANRRGDTWTEKRLNALLQKPTGVYGGTSMPMNFSKVEDRKAIIAYLKTLRPE
jgi:cytochrome c